MEECQSMCQLNSHYYQMLMRAHEGNLTQKDLQKIKASVDSYNIYIKDIQMQK